MTSPVGAFPVHKTDTMTARYAIETTSLIKKFPNRTGYRAMLPFGRREELTAVDDVSLRVRERELLGLLGPNGAGKTTLVKMLSTLILPTAGHAQVCGHDVVSEASVVRRDIGLVDCQERSFFWRLSGRQNLEFFAALQGLHGGRAKERIAELLAFVGLAEHAERWYMTYSSGMRQRLAIARGLLTLPRVLFLDEVTRGVDPQSARDLRIFVREQLISKMGCTIIWVTHQLREVEEICDRVAIMNRGRLIACESIADIKRLIPGGQIYHLQVYNLSPSSVIQVRTLPGVMQVEPMDGDPQGSSWQLALAGENGNLSSVIHALVEQGGSIHHCAARDVSLEEVFISLVGNQDGA